MKILFLVPYKFDTSITSASNNTGLSYIIRSVVSGFSERGHKVYVFGNNGFTAGYSNNNLTVLRKKKMDFLPLSFKYLKKYKYDFKKIKLSIPEKIYYLRNYLFGSLVEKYIKKIKPDIVSIIGLTHANMPFYYAASDTGADYIVSLHGLNWFTDNKLTDLTRSIEKMIFLKSEKEGRPLTVISTGIKEKAAELCGLKNTDNIKVVCNGTDDVAKTVPPEDSSRLKEKIGIKESDKVFICAGSFTENKNQSQIIRAFMLLPKEIRDNTKILFLGKGPYKQAVDNLIEENNLNEFIIDVGFVKKEDLAEYYSISDINILASKVEGFGLSFIEGYLYGIPSVTFKDLYAVKDVYSPDAMVLADSRDDNALANAMIEAYNREWDKNAIISHASSFTIEKMIDGYEKVFSDRIESVK